MYSATVKSSCPAIQKWREIYDHIVKLCVGVNEEVMRSQCGGNEESVRRYELLMWR